jgi:hypothetical protein
MYPEHLTPPKNENGVILYDKFPEWWAWAKEHFPTVPENAAQYWLHENWGVSPYYYIKSRDYRFEAVEWPSARLFELRSKWDDFDPELEGCIRGGRREHRKFPQPIVMLDNRAGHLVKEYEGAWRVPSGYVLIEGHMRLNIAVYLQSRGLFNPTFEAWLMTKNQT